MKCGEKGHLSAKTGLPCEQNINPKAPGCLWHSRTPEERSQLATKGAIKSRMQRALPDDFVVPVLDTFDERQTFLKELAQLALTKDIDAWRIEKAIKAVAGITQEEQVRAIKQQAEAIAALEYGKTTVAIVQQFLGAQPSARRRPLPGLARAAAQAGDAA